MNHLSSRAGDALHYRNAAHRSSAGENDSVFGPAERTTVTITIEEISPERARKMLEGNIRNRKVSQKKVLEFADEMRKGRWRTNTTEPIGITPQGVLVDGQHRLLSVIESGVTVRMAVNRNAEESDLEVINTGKSRTIGDLFEIKGVPGGRNLASVISNYLTISRSGLISYRRGFRYCFLEYYETYKENPEMWEAIGKFSNKMNSRGSGILTAKMVGGFYGVLLFDLHHSTDIIERFFHEVDIGVSKCVAVSQLTVRLANDKKSTKVKIPEVVKARLMAKAWNLFVSGKNRTELLVKVNEDIKLI